MDRPAAVVIRRNRQTGEFLVLSLARGPGEFGGDYGVALLHLSPEEMRTRGLEVILDDLREYHKRRWPEASKLARMSRAEQRRFDRAHLSLDVVEVLGSASAQLKLVPMGRDRRAGFQSVPGEVRVVSAKSTNEEFFEQLQDAFERCN